MEQNFKRLVTRSDFDGLACAMMLKELKMIDEIKFVHPKDVQDGKVELFKTDITTNLPYDPRVGMAFDHHESEIDRLKAIETNGKLIIDPNARSAARVVYDYFGGKASMPRISDELMSAVDKGDSADFNLQEIKFVHPKDVQDGKVELSKEDITTNLPYDPRVGMAFDHHESEIDRLKATETNGKLIIDPKARSAARVVYDYFGGKAKMSRISDELMEAVDKGDSADFTLDEILNPKGWVLLHYLMDARTGLGRFRNFRISNYDLMMELIDYCLQHNIDDILALPDVKVRVDLYFEQAQLFKDQLRRIAKLHGKVIVLDLRAEEVIHAGNRFMVYALYPEAQISVHVAWGFQKQNTAVMIGKSIVNKRSEVDIGELCLKYGGGGHRNAGTCQLANDVVDKELPNIIEALNQ